MNEGELFIAALQIENAADRTAYLSQACGSDIALSERVEVLLKASAQAGSFLQQPAYPLGVTNAETIRESPGTVIGPYKLLQEIGEGGMGTVFMAEQSQPIQRRVALKVIKPGMDSRQVIARFEAERQALAMMDHVNIARVFDGGATGPASGCPGRPYFVMELVHGVPITKYCDDNHLTPRERLELFVPVCQAIQHAHQKGIIHRDIKPSNVMVTLYDGKPVPKVIDFGVAKATEQKLTELTLFTQYGTMVGTLEYMSPEQAEMSALGVDTRSDIYSLGVLLYELLTGSTPLTRQRMKDAAYAEILRMIKEEEPPKPSTRLSDSGAALASISANRQTEPAKLTTLVKGELDWIVMKCLEKDRNRRYETANGFADDVQRYLADEPVQACPPSVGYRLRKFVRRNRAPVLAALGLVSLLLVTLGVTLHSNAQVNRALTERTTAYAKLEIEQKATREARDAARESERLAKQHAVDLTESLYFESIARADLEYRTNNVAQADQTLDRCPEELRHWEWRYLKRICRSQSQTLNGHDAFVTWISFHPNGRWLVSGGNDGRLIIWDFVSGEVIRRLPETKEAVTSTEFSPDGRYLASAAGRWLPSVPGVITVWEVATGAEVASFKQDTSHIDEIAWSPDSREVAGASWSGVVKVCDLATKTQRVLTAPGTPTTLKAVAWSGDGALIAAAGNDGKVRIWDAATGKHLRAYIGHTGAIGSLAFSPDGKRLISSAMDQTIRVWDAHEGKLYRTLTTLSSSGGQLVYSADGQRFAASCNDGTVMIWDAAQLVPLETIHAHSREARGIAFHPGGDLLASAGWDKTVKIWDVRTPQRHRTATLPNARGRQIAVSPDGKTFAVAALLPVARGQPGYHRLYDTSTLKEIRCLSEHWGGHHSAAFHPDGHLLAADEDALVVLWDVKTGERRRTLEGHEKAVRHVAFSPDRRYLATASEDKTVRLWDLTTYQTTAVFRGHGDAVTRVAFSNDSRTLVSAGQDGKVLLWPVGPESASPLRSFEGHVGAVNTLAFRPGEQQFATGADDNTVRIWDAATGRELHRLGTHVASVTALGFTPDGSRLASGGKDGLVVVWDANKGREALSFRRELIDVSGLAFLPDGRRLIAVNHTAMTGGCRIWDAGRLRPEDATAQLLALSQMKPPAPTRTLANESLALSRTKPPAPTRTLANEAMALYGAGKWQAAAEKYLVLIQDEPDDFIYRGNRAFALGALGRLKEAREDYAHAIHLPSAAPRSAHYAGAAFFYCNILIELGDIDAYQRESNYIRGRIGFLRSPTIAVAVSMVYRLGPHPAEEIAELVAAVEPLYRNQPKDVSAGLSMATVNYLAGRHLETLACLDVVTANRTSAHNQIVETLYYALTHARLGNRDKAREYLSKSKAWMDAHLNSGKTPPDWAFAPHWSYRLDLERLRKEAEGLLE